MVIVITLYATGNIESIEVVQYIQLLQMKCDARKSVKFLRSHFEIHMYGTSKKKNN